MTVLCYIPPAALRRAGWTSWYCSLRIRARNRGTEPCYIAATSGRNATVTRTRPRSYTLAGQKFSTKSKNAQPRARGSRVTGDGALLRRGIPEHNKKQSCGVTRACPLLRATCKFPYSIKENNVTETRPLLHVTQAPPLRRFAIDSRA